MEVGIHISLVLNCFKHTYTKEQGTNVYITENRTREREREKTPASKPLHLVLSLPSFSFAVNTCTTTTKIIAEVIFISGFLCVRQINGDRQS